jgi:transcriptional regulator with GAF, ATPase, and Fis domain
MWQLYAFAQQIAASASSVLITGETGVGKELMAQAIHRNSPRASRELVILNCAAIPEGLVESELFGYERGAFSGAVTAKPGLFEAAHCSTFFLDEVGELPLSVQAKLLRVLETGDVTRLGAVRPTRVDVRIVTATNRHLPTEVARGVFRADLFYRLNGLTIAIPPLRERPDDIEELARHFAESSAARPGLRFSKAALEALRAYPWPGNVRELKSVVERAALVNQGGLVEPHELMLEVASSAPPAATLEPAGGVVAQGEAGLLEAFTTEELPTSVVRAELERRELRRTKEALERTAGNQTEAARLLGISRRTLMNRMDRFGINRPRKGSGKSDDD